MTDPIRISYSAVRSFRKCEQDYKYGYIQGLRPKVRFAPMELGTVIHNYFDQYYGLMVEATERYDADDLHDVALRKTVRAARRECKQLAYIARDAGADGDAVDRLLAIPDLTHHLMTAYHRVHGRDDAGQRIVLVEEPFEMRLVSGVVLSGRIDMVTEDERGYWLWEHKTTGNVPPVAARLRDLQTAMYAPAVKRLFGIDLAGIVWNNIHTAPVRPPAILASGKMSVDRRCVTTLELTEQAIAGAAEPGDYEPFLDYVRQRERQQMFPRYELPLSQDTALLMGDVRRTAKRIGRARGKGTAWRAVRNIDAHCEWCSFRPLCQGVIAGGDEDVIMRTEFTQEERKHGKGNSNSKGATTRRRGRR